VCGVVGWWYGVLVGGFEFLPCQLSADVINYGRRGGGGERKTHGQTRDQTIATGGTPPLGQRHIEGQGAVVTPTGQRLKAETLIQGPESWKKGPTKSTGGNRKTKERGGVMKTLLGSHSS